MQNPLFSDLAIRSVRWRDLVPLRRTETLKELTLILPWLAATLWLAGHNHWVAAAPTAFMLFLCGLRSAHDAQHYNLGIPRWSTDVFMVALSLVLLGSMHAVQVNHFRHHRHCLSEDDFEAKSARMRWWQAILYGPVFFVLIHRVGFRHGSRAQRRWIAVELSTIVGWVFFVITMRPGPALETLTAMMLLGECLTAFFAVWVVHHDVDPSMTVARTERGWRNTLFYGMFYHLEHHLFPQVPTPHLPRLAARLDRVRPDLREATVLP